MREVADTIGMCENVEQGERHKFVARLLIKLGSSGERAGVREPQSIHI